MQKVERFFGIVVRRSETRRAYRQMERFRDAYIGGMRSRPRDGLRREKKHRISSPFLDAPPLFLARRLIFLGEKVRGASLHWTIEPPPPVVPVVIDLHHRSCAAETRAQHRFETRTSQHQQHRCESRRCGITLLLESAHFLGEFWTQLSQSGSR